MSKLAIICNGPEPTSLFPTFVVGSAAAAMGEDVILFFTPGAAPALRRGVLETVRAKGMPDMRELVDSFQALGGRILVCDLCVEAADVTQDELRDGVEIVGVTTFLADTQDATRSFAF